MDKIQFPMHRSTYPSPCYEYKGYKIPIRLLNLTGGGTGNFDIISQAHIHNLKKYINLSKNDNILEIGCGIGRDAIPLTEFLDKKAKYYGVDIIKDSIDWCTNNITKNYDNFKFIHYNIKDQLHNPSGTDKTTNIKLNIENNSIDKIIAWSVFTHMYPKDIEHYLKEFNRILKNDGELYLTCFIFSDEILKKTLETNLTIFNLTFQHPLSEDIRINDVNYPLGAIAFTKEYITNLVSKCGFRFKYSKILNGSWSGYHTDIHDGQDVLVLQKSNC